MFKIYSTASYLYRCGLVLILLVLFSCKQARKVADIRVRPTPRELYARQFENDSTVFSQWEESFQKALGDSIQIELPYEEDGTFFQGNRPALSYVVELYQGEIFHAEVNTDSLAPPMFIDLYRQIGDSIISYDFMARSEYLQKNLDEGIEESGRYKIIVQAGLKGTSDFQLLMYTTPSYAFPVAGKDNEAIQSFWGADRDGGRRSHKGVDIFANRGTPVIAVTEGRISSTGNRGLGGKQVWLRSGLLGNSLYYAHLDSIAVGMGKKVEVGDTLGFVGNTGNARTTAPHLHFGIYKGYRGAIDPLPFIRINDRPDTSGETVSLETPEVTVTATRANLRNRPSTQGRPIGEAEEGERFTILGITGKWVHISTASGMKAYVHRSLTTISIPSA